MSTVGQFVGITKKRPLNGNELKSCTSIYHSLLAQNCRVVGQAVGQLLYVVNTLRVTSGFVKNDG